MARWSLDSVGSQEVQLANNEMNTAEAAIEACMAKADASVLATYSAWDGTQATSPTATDGSNSTIYASDMLRNAFFKATYTFDVNGTLVSAALTPAPGNTAWIGIKWNTSTLSWVKA